MVASQQERLVYWIGTEIELIIGLVLMAIALHRWAKAGCKMDSVVGAALSFILPDVGMVLVFVPLHLFDLLHSHDTDAPSGWCVACAFATITCLCALFCLSVLLAWSTWRVTVNRPVTQREIVAGNIAAWAIGAGVASGYAGQEVLGMYKGLYCCIRESSYKSYLVLPNFGFFAVCLALMVYFYGRALHNVHEVESRAREHRDSVSPHESDSGKKGPEEHKMFKAVARHCALFCAVFIVSWLLMMINGLITFVSGGNGTHIWMDIAAAWSAKLQPAINAIVLLQLLRKVKNTRSRGSQGHHGHGAAKSRVGREVIPANPDAANTSATAHAASVDSESAGGKASGAPTATELTISSGAVEANI